MFNTLGNSISRSWLVWEWLLDGNALDTSWRWNNWTATNVTWVKTDRGYQSQAGSFNGSSSWINLWTANIFQSSTQFSISCIYRPSQLTTFQNIVRMQRKCNIFCWQFEWPTYNKIEIQMLNSWLTASQSLFSNTLLEVGKYYLIEFKCNKWNVELWINWKLDNSASWWSIFTWAVTAQYIWREWPWYYAFWNIQNVRIRNWVFSNEDSQLLYLESLRKLWPTNIAEYPALLSWLVGYWDFRWDAYNLVDWVAWTVTWATLTTDRFWNSNSAYSFDGNNGYITTPNLSWNIWDADFSISWYINYSTFSSIDRVYMSWTRDFSIETYSDWRIWLDFYNWASYQTKSNVLTANTYYHFVWVRSKTGGLFMYINWNLVWTGTFIWNAEALSWTDSFWKDSRKVTSKSKFILDELTIFNRALSSSEVKALYELTSKDRIYPSKVYDLPSLREWLVLEYNWSNNWATTLYDTS